MWNICGWHWVSVSQVGNALSGPEDTFKAMVTSGTYSLFI